MRDLLFSPGQSKIFLMVELGPELLEGRPRVGEFKFADGAPAKVKPLMIHRERPRRYPADGTEDLFHIRESGSVRRTDRIGMRSRLLVLDRTQLKFPQAPLRPTLTAAAVSP